MSADDSISIRKSFWQCVRKGLGYGTIAGFVASVTFVIGTGLILLIGGYAYWSKVASFEGVVIVPSAIIGALVGSIIGALFYSRQDKQLHLNGALLGMTVAAIFISPIIVGTLINSLTFHTDLMRSIDFWLPILILYFLSGAWVGIRLLKTAKTD